MWLTGVLFDKYGSYQIAFTTICVLLIIAFFASTQIKKELQPSEETTADKKESGPAVSTT